MRDLAAVADGAYDKATLHLSGLKEIAKKFGPDSTEVKRAKEMLRLTLDVSRFYGGLPCAQVSLQALGGLCAREQH